MGLTHGRFATAATKHGLTFSDSSTTAFLFLDTMAETAGLDAASIAWNVCWRVTRMLEELGVECREPWRRIGLKVTRNEAKNGDVAVERRRMGWRSGAASWLEESGVDGRLVA